MAEASIVREGVDRFREAVGTLEDEFQRVQKQMRQRRKKLEKRLESRRKDFEKRSRKLRSEIEKSSAAKRLDAWRRDARKQFEQSISDVLSVLRIATKHDLQRIDRKISQLNKKLKEIEQAEAGGRARESAA